MDVQRELIKGGVVLFLASRGYGHIHPQLGGEPSFRLVLTKNIQAPTAGGEVVSGAVSARELRQQIGEPYASSLLPEDGEVRFKLVNRFWMPNSGLYYSTVVVI